MIATIAQLRELNANNGMHWFDPETMFFFKSRIETEILRGKYFISSEQQPYAKRRFSVRTFDDHGGIGTVGGFCQHKTLRAALKAIDSL